MKELNAKQLAFLNEYLSNGYSAKRAYAAVYEDVTEGTASANGSKLLTDPRIKELISKHQEELKNKLLISKEDLIKDLAYIKEKKKESNPQAALKAIELISKFLGYQQPTQSEVTVKGEQPLFGPGIDSTSESEEDQA